MQNYELVCFNLLWLVQPQRAYLRYGDILCISHTYCKVYNCMCWLYYCKKQASLPPPPPGSAICQRMSDYGKRKSVYIFWRYRQGLAGSRKCGNPVSLNGYFQSSYLFAIQLVIFLYIFLVSVIIELCRHPEFGDWRR